MAEPKPPSILQTDTESYKNKNVINLEKREGEFLFVEDNAGNNSTVSPAEKTDSTPPPPTPPAMQAYMEAQEDKERKLKRIQAGEILDEESGFDMHYPFEIKTAREMIEQERTTIQDNLNYWHTKHNMPMCKYHEDLLDLLNNDPVKYFSDKRKDTQETFNAIAKENKENSANDLLFWNREIQ